MAITVHNVYFRLATELIPGWLRRRRAAVSNFRHDSPFYDAGFELHAASERIRIVICLVWSFF